MKKSSKDFQKKVEQELGTANVDVRTDANAPITSPSVPFGKEIKSRIKELEEASDWTEKVKAEITRVSYELGYSRSDHEWREKIASLSDYCPKDSVMGRLVTDIQIKLLKP